MIRLLLAAFLLQAVCAVPLEYYDDITPRPGESCGYESCHQVNQNLVNIHLIPHTHDDVGWLKTVDQYYYGSSSQYQKAGVGYILDSVVRELWEDPNRRFIYVETAFFWKWWVQQDESIRSRVHTLVRQGRLEFIGGAWSMNDEASTHYQSTIDQFTFGLKTLNDTFGECGRPRAGWQIDPFGHAREFANILAGMSYDGYFLGRIDWQDRVQRRANKTMEMIWRGDDDIGKASDIFTGVMYIHYSPPGGFCFDYLCNDEPIIDDVKSPIYNVDERVTEFLDVMTQWASAYDHNHVLVTMGDDFHYMNAGMWFKNIDKLIKYANAKAEREGLNVRLLYSTPSCYIKAVKDANPRLPTKQDDFFPYSTDPMAYWTGYFTSRPTTKYFERQGNEYLQANKQLQVLARLDKENEKALDELKAAMGVMQHHDAITGTEKQYVTHDYERLLNKAIDEALVIARQAFNKFTQGDVAGPLLSYDRCMFNQSQCAISEDGDRFVLTIYNPLGWEVTAPIRVPVVNSQYTVLGPDGRSLPTQIAELSNAVLNIPTRFSKATHELVFIAENMPPVGYKQYYVTKQVRRQLEDAIDNAIERPLSEEPRIGERVLQRDIENEHYRLTYDESTGEITHVTLPDGTQFKMSFNMLYYKGSVGDNSAWERRSSGAYIFRPNGTKADAAQRIGLGKVVRGPIFDQIQYEYEFGTLEFTLYKNRKLENMYITWTVGIDVSDDVGKEVVILYQTDIINNGEFYTDSNGRQLLKRKLNLRPQFNTTLDEPVPGNYYPVTNKIVISDSNNRLAVITDRSEGGTSLDQGQIELMVHRRLLHDDAFGVGEALNESAFNKPLVARGNHYIYLAAANKNNEIKERAYTLEHHLPPQTYVSDAKDLTSEAWLKLSNVFTAFKSSLQVGLHLLTLEPWSDGAILIRLENYLEKADRSNTNLEVDLSSLFADLNVVGIRETNLAGNQWLEDNSKWVWQTSSDFSASFNEEYGFDGQVPRATDTVLPNTIVDFKVKLAAKQIRTFALRTQL